MKQEERVKVIKNVEVCESQEIKEGEVYYYEIDYEDKDGTAKKFPILIIRHKGKLYGLSGECPHE